MRTREDIENRIGIYSQVAKQQEAQLMLTYNILEQLKAELSLTYKK